MSIVEGSGNIVQDNLVYFLDVANVKSYSSGNRINDLSKVEKVAGTLLNSPTYSNLNNGSLVFDGVNQYVSLDKNIAFTTNSISKYSFSIWFSPSVLISSGSTNTYMIFEAQNASVNAATDNYLQITPGYSGRISFTTFNFSNNDLNTTTNRWEINKWYNITCTYDSATSKKSIYVNGVLENFTTIANCYFNTNTCFGLGAYTAPPRQWFFNGKISNFMVYNKTLSAIEILQNYNAIKTRFGL